MRDLRASLESLVLHLHPRAVPAEALRFSRTLGAGGASLVLVLVAAVTGSLLLAGYDPSPERAHGSVARLAELPFGPVLRSAHRWAGDGAIAVASLHLLRVLFRGAYLAPRHLNWLVGLGLLSLVVGSGFTGRLLTWDQLGFWSIQISSAMLEYLPIGGTALLRLVRGGVEVGPRTLSLFYGLHVALLPFALCVLLAVHFWQVRKVGGVLLPDEPQAGARRPFAPASPNLTLREGVAALVTVAAVLLLAAVSEAPLLSVANPGMSPDPARAPWFLAGLQELLVHVHPAFGAVVLPALAAALLVALPALPRGERSTGLWFQSPRGRRTAAGAALAALALAPGAVIADALLRHRPAVLPWVTPWIRTGLVPSAFACAIVGAVAWLARRRGATRLEATQAAFAFVLTALLVLTVVGAAFRGPGIALQLPFATIGSRGAP